MKITYEIKLTKSTRFRWVDCQLTAISGCRNKRELRKVLDELPRNLEEQYGRELRNVSEEDAATVITLLKWLTFPRRKFRMDKIVEILAFNYEGEKPCFDPEGRCRQDAQNDLVDLCGCLIRKDSNPDRFDHRGRRVPGGVTTLTTSHATVLDFLTDSEVIVSRNKPLRFDKAELKMQMATTCLVYMEYLFDNEAFDSSVVDEYPFARFAAEYWDDYYREWIQNRKDESDASVINGYVFTCLIPKKHP